ncbi:MAG: LamB/YcsF family protein [bacterium]|jgi:UPF0271 protein
MLTVDLNCDMGESFGTYQIGSDAKIVGYISSVNIACGFHAGDPAVLRKTVLLAREHGKTIGAHPGYPDLPGFGRRNMELSEQEVEVIMLYQIGALNAFCRAAGVPLRHVKPHGALYNQAAKDKKLAGAVARSVKAFDPGLILVGLAGSEMITAGLAAGLAVAGEAFADRNYHADGSLVSRRDPRGIINDPNRVAERVVRMVREGLVETVEGTDLPLHFNTICLHGDTPGAVILAAAVSERLRAAGIEISSL